MALHLFPGQETDPISPTGKEVQALWGATESVCRCSPFLLSVFSAPPPWDQCTPDSVWQVMGSEPTASTALLQRATRIKQHWRKNIKQGKKIKNECGGIKKNQMSTSGCSSQGTLSVSFESSCTQPQMHVSLQFNIFSNPGKKKRNSSRVIIIQQPRNVPSLFFWQSRGRFWLFPLYLLWYPWNPCIMLELLSHTKEAANLP